MYARHPGRTVLRRAARAGRRAGLVRTRGPGRASGSARAIPPRLHRGGDRVPAARRRVENWHGAVASDTARESGLCTSGVIMSQGFTVHPPYSCAPGNVQDECLTLMGVHLGGPRPTNCACWRCGPDQDFAVGGVRLWRRGGPAADDCRCRVRRRGSGRGRVPRARLCLVRLGQWPDWRRGWGVASGGAGRLVRVAYGDIVMLTGNLTLTG
jgi:hypothetical protein